MADTQHTIDVVIDSPYSPIVTGHGEIRLLEIKPGEYDDDIKISLKHVRISQSPSYTALSYVWGSAKASRPCLLQGMPMAITKNLDQALRQFRSNIEASVLWADALSINQSDLTERAAQVRLMKEIYEKALSIFAWLGQPHDNRKIEEATELLNFIEDDYNVTMSAVEDTEGYTAQNSPLPGAVGSKNWRAWDGIAEIFSSEYFTRMWIVQEATSPTHIRFNIGKHSFGKIALHQAVALVDTFSTNSDFPQKVVQACNSISSVGQIVESLRERGNGRFNMLLRLMQDFRGSKCMDPLDRVYAALSLASDASAARIAVDYSIPLIDLYSGAARTLIMDPETSLKVLGAVIALTDDAQLDSVMPSWVPDWRLPLMVPGISETVNSKDLNNFLYNPFRGTVIASFNNLELSIEGIISHEAGILFMTDPWESNFESSSTVLGWFEELLHQGGGSSDLETALRRSCIGDRSLGGYDEDEEMFHFKRGGLLDLELAKSDTGSLDQDALQNLLVAHHLLASVCFTRKMAILSRGRVAVLPAAAEIGDKVAAFRGGHALYLLRRLGAGQDQYRFIGECYVDGWMDGDLVGEVGEVNVETITIV